MTTITRRQMAPVFTVPLILGSLFLSACQQKGADAASPAVVAVQSIGPENIALVAQDTLRTGPQLSGRLVPEREARIRAEVAGAVLQTMVEQGEHVTPGTTLGRIDDAAVNEQLLSAKSLVIQAQIGADKATRELQRTKTLLAAGAVSDRDLEVADWGNANAQAQLADAKARLSSAEKNLRNTIIRAPFVGVVSERNVSPGDIVSPGAALFTVVDPSSLRLEASVPAEAIGSIHVGAPVVFTVNGYPGRTFEGRVTRINPTADEQTRQVRIYATVANASGRLVGGLFANGRVTSQSHAGLVVPDKAVDLHGLTPFVVRLKSGKVEKVEVAVGLHDAATETTEITKGLAAGDTLLLAAAQGISVGTPVRVTAPRDPSRP